MNVVWVNPGKASMQNFYSKVRTGGDWDYKNNPNSPYYSANFPGGFVFSAENVGSDFPGNFNFGYVGASTWWGNNSLLLRAAGLAQGVSNISNGKLAPWNPPYFDNPGDSSQIMQGISYKY